MSTNIWPTSQRFCSIQTDDPAVARQIKQWPFARLIAWGVNCYLEQFNIPRSRLPWVLKKLALIREQYQEVARGDFDEIHSGDTIGKDVA